MNELNRVVAHLLDGTVIKGTTSDFDPDQPAFHFLPSGSIVRRTIRIEELKALFFVKDLAGSPERQDLPGFFVRRARERGMGAKTAVLFSDGELVCGYTLGYKPEGRGFFLTPAEPLGNNLRLYIPSHAAVEIGVGQAAEDLVRRKRGLEAA
jgi:hypothetical protein